MSGSWEHPLVAEVYDAIPSHRNRTDVSFYRRLAAGSSGSVLELGSGTGRVLIPIARAGKRVYGLEESEHMLARCRKKLDLKPRDVTDNVELVRGRFQSFDLREQFGLIICPFNSFLHLLSVESQVSCLARVNRHLVPGGRFAFDVFDPDIRQMTDDRFTQASLPQLFKLPTGSTVELRHRNRSVDFVGQLIESEISLKVTHRDGDTEQVVHPIRQRYLFRSEAERLLDRCGFAIESLYGDFEESPYDPARRGSLVFVARKG